MQLRNSLGGLALVVSLATGGCFVSGSARVRPVAVVEVESEPPPPQQEVFEVRPGFVWITGHWQWNGNQYVWAAGHYERERVGYVWNPGRWEQRGQRHVWIEGEWHAGASGNVQVRDHRTPAPAPAPGPEVRDHRH